MRGWKLRTWIRRGFAVACFVPLTGAHGNLHLNLTDSLPRGIYRETHEPIMRGVLAVECLPAELAELGKKRGWLWQGSCPTGVPPILKRVVAVAGDTVELGKHYVAVNGEVLLGTATLFLDSNGREIPHVARGIYQLSEGEVFLLADNPTSWDNRYTGPTQVKNIIGTARPVFTFRERTL